MESQTIIYDCNGIRPIKEYTYYYIDSTNILSFNQIKLLPDSEFIQKNNNSLDFGDGDKTLWLRFSFENKIDEPIYLITSHLRLIDIFEISKSGQISQQFGGFLRPISNLPFGINNPAYNLNKSGGQVFIKIKNRNLNIRLEITDKTSFIKKYHSIDLYIGFIIGLMLAISIYNLILFFTIKEKLHLYYFLYVISSIYIILRVNGLHHEFLGNNQILMLEANFSASLTVLFLFIFSNNYLNIKQLAPKYFKWLFFLAILNLLAGITDFFPFHTWMNQFSQIAILFFVVSLLITSIYIWKIGYEPAKYFVFSFSFYILGVVITIFGLLGIFISWHKTPFVPFAYNIGAILETIFFSIAIGYRMNLIKTQASDAQQLALKRAQENELLFQRNNELIAEKINTENKELPKFFLSLQQAKLKKLSVPTIQGTLYFPLEDVVRLEAMGSYCTIYFIESKKIVASRPMAFFETMLDENLFLRIHKSHIVNLQKVKEYIRGEGGFVKMIDKNEIPVSRSMKAILLEKLKLKY